MASAGPPAGRRLIESLKPFRRRPVCAFLISKHSLRNSRQSCRSISTVSSQLSEMEVDDQTPPRWSQTPPQMKAPVSINRNPKVFEVNTNPRKLDDAYIRFLGQGGDKMLSDETKWLAVTHKSFDHGRRGFNDRLAYLGKHILELQTSLGMISTSTSAHPKNMDDPYGRVPFSHPATESVETLIGRTRTWFTYHKQLSNLSVRYGIPDVVRWQPRLPDNLNGSGANLVYAQAILAIIGALSLEQGNAVANRIARERILAPLGLRKLTSPQAENKELE